MERNSFNSFLQPLKNFDELLYTIYLLTHLKHLHLDSLCLILERITHRVFLRSDLELFMRKLSLFSEQYGINFFSTIHDLPEMINNILKSESKCLKFVSPAISCSFCSSKSLNEMNGEDAISYFVSQKPMKASIIAKKCFNCGACHYLSYAEKEQSRKPFDYFTENRFIAFSRETIFETHILKMFTSDLLFKHSTFQGFCSAFNHLSSFANYLYQCIPDRIYLEEKRLIENWFIYKAMKFSEEYFFGLDGLPFPYLKNLDNYLRCLKPYLLPYFCKKWSGIYHKSLCRHPNCSLTVNLDGNFKCNRLKCMFENVFMKVQEIGKRLIRKLKI
jgi:hypothetical protein